MALTMTTIGVYGGNAGANPGHTAAIGWFRRFNRRAVLEGRAGEALFWHLTLFWRLIVGLFPFALRPPGWYRTALWPRSYSCRK